MPYLEITNLKKQFAGNVVFKDLNVNTKSYILGIGGANGSGKSTLLKCMCGLLKPSLGKIQWYLNNREYSPQQVRTKMGLLAPFVQLYDGLTCIENIRFLDKLRNTSNTTCHSEKILNHFNMQDYADQLYGSLSTGQQQRIKFAAATLHNPSILLLDEPGSNLDVEGKDVVREMINIYRSNNDMVVVASNQKEELDLCDEVIMLS
ncbi:MAG: ATP-binding cassette domain-containing protein [Balneolaceae bacterium]